MKKSDHLYVHIYYRFKISKFSLRLFQLMAWQLSTLDADNLYYKSEKPSVCLSVCPSAFHLMSRTYSQTTANFKASLVPKEALTIWEHNGVQIESVTAVVNRPQRIERRGVEQKLSQIPSLNRMQTASKQLSFQPMNDFIITLNNIM